MTLPPLPVDRPVLAFYGDDFTGSGGVMEALSFAGLPTVLFLEPPTNELVARFPGTRAIGLAGDARTRSPDWMRAELPEIFAGLRALGAPILHYKICSTLDSAPHVGSIGVAAEIGLADGGIAPLVVAAPRIGRWQAFGTVFARALGIVALTAEAPVAHGAALLRGHRADGSTLEIALKGGQMGTPDFFVRLRDGQATAGGTPAA